MPAEEFEGHVATVGSLGKWGACGWSDGAVGIMMKNWGLCTGCTVRWTLSLRFSAPSRELRWPFLVSLFKKKIIAPTKVHVDNRGSLMGCGKER